jgi:lactoylglutathione lyase
VLLRLSHVIVYCSDMKRSVQFYRDVLGFPVKFESEKWTELHSGPATLALHLEQPRAGASSDSRAPGRAAPALEVVDLEKFYQEKKSQGAKFASAPAMQDFGQKMAVILDPDGLPIAVAEERR